LLREGDKIGIMKILLIADGRSPITQSWIKMLQPLGHELVLVSSYPCATIELITRQYILPLAFASQAGGQTKPRSKSLKKQLIAQFRPFAQSLRHWLGPWILTRQVDAYLEILRVEKPDIVHAMRVPFEGMLASYTPSSLPVVVSTWGNDFTLHAPSTARMKAMTRKTMRRADGILSDTRRDLKLASEWGFDPSKPGLVVAGNGGLDLAELQSMTRGIQRTDPPQVINPRGLRSYVRTDTFFKSIPLVLAKRPETQFVCTSMAGQAEAQNWVERLGISYNVRLLPLLSQVELWKEFARSTVSVSPSTHDGTPNTLLEAMALGCLPVCGDLDSIREWITPGENGLLVDPADEKDLAKAILKALDDVMFRDNTSQINLAIIQKQADLAATRAKVRSFYERYR
jgi:glycosyltransferase involved in cell wall biosynthesis